LVAVLGYKFVSAHGSREPAGRMGGAAAEIFARGPEGPALNEHAISTLRLAASKVQDVNQIIKGVEKEFIDLEERHTEHFTDAVGHVHLTIKPFAPQMSNLTAQMWEQLGRVLEPGQLAKARNLHLERLFGNNAGKNTVTIELWNENGQYHFIDSQDGGGDSAKATSRASSGASARIIPPRYRSYLKEEQGAGGP